MAEASNLMLKKFLGEIPLGVWVFLFGIGAHGVISWHKIDQVIYSVNVLAKEVKAHTETSGHPVAFSNIQDLKQRVYGIEQRERNRLENKALRNRSK